MCQWRKLADLSTHRQLKHKLPRELPGEGAPGRRGQLAKCGGREGREESCCPGREKLLAPSQAGSPGAAPQAKDERSRRREPRLREGTAECRRSGDVWGIARSHRHRDRHSASRALRDLTLPFLTHLHTTRTLFWHTTHTLFPHMSQYPGDTTRGKCRVGGQRFAPRPSANGRVQDGTMQGAHFSSRGRHCIALPSIFPQQVSGEGRVGWAPGLCLVSCVIRN